MPVDCEQGGIEERVLELDFVADGRAIVAEEFDIVVDHAVTEPEGGGRKLVGDVGVHRRVVAVVPGQRAVAEQRRQPLVVGDRLNLGDHDRAGLLVDLLVGQLGIRGGDFRGPGIVLAHEEGLHRGELDVFVRADVAGEEVAGRVHRQHVAGAGVQLAAGERAQAVGRRLVGAVDHRAVDPGGDLVDLLAWVGCARAGGGVVSRAGEVDDLRAGAGGIEVRVAGGDGNIGLDGAGRGRLGEIDVVVEELAPDIDIGRELAVAGGIVAAWATMVLLITRGLGRSAPASESIPLP